MVESDQLHTPPALFLKKPSSLPIQSEAEWTPEPVWMLIKKHSWSCWQTNHNSAVIGRGTMLNKWHCSKYTYLHTNGEYAESHSDYNSAMAAFWKQKGWFQNQWIHDWSYIYTSKSTAKRRMIPEDTDNASDTATKWQDQNAGQCHLRL